ncbi:MAG: site-specific DNA-methyltransferase [Verrucomicrobiales bacterium]|nr:site-specific DNA-methyltransferase [Verrucomicrobiales bacterium]
MKKKPSPPRPRNCYTGDETKPGRIICGDALIELQQMASGSVQLVIADPPYFQVLDHAWDQQWPDAEAYLDWSMTWLGEAMRVLCANGLIYCFGQLGKREHTFLHLMAAATHRWQFHDLITWDRVVGYNERRDSFTPATELILVLRKSAKPKFNKSAVREPYDAATIKEYLRDKRYQDQAARRRHLAAGKFATNLWRIPSLKGRSGEKCGHPTQKPLKLIERIVLTSSDPGDLVLDPFLGSGTTAMVAKQHGRRWLGIEMEPAYVKIARQRLKAKING